MIQIEAIEKRFDHKPVLRGVDLEIRQGETHVILGRSGEGKSVLLKLICGLIEPDAGQIRIDGAFIQRDDEAALRRMRESIQMLFQGGALFDSMSVAENVAFHATEHGRARVSDAPRIAREFLEMVDLSDVENLMPSELSGGMRKRAALARALAASPRVMLYDEPTTGLDPVTSQVINQLIRETGRRLGVTSIVVTHDLKSAQTVGDRCSFLYEGRIIETTTPRQLAQSTHEIVRRFAQEATVAA